MKLMILFKTPRQEEEFWSEKIDPRIRAIILELARYSQNNFNKTMVITHVCRTIEEQNQLYPDWAPQHNGKIKPSAHLDKPSRAVDIRSSIYTLEEIEELKSWFEKWFDIGWLWSFIYPDGIAGLHIHCQCSPLPSET